LQTSFVESKPAEKQPENRIDQWKRKILDLSLRNRLLNYRVTAKTIQLVVVRWRVWKTVLPTAKSSE
jgi:hypothetical protein